MLGKLEECSGILCDMWMPVKTKGKIYQTVVTSETSSPVGAETWATTKQQEARTETNETRVLRWMCGETKKDKIRSEYVRGTTRVTQA